MWGCPDTAPHWVTGVGGLNQIGITNHNFGDNVINLLINAV